MLSSGCGLKMRKRQRLLSRLNDEMCSACSSATIEHGILTGWRDVESGSAKHLGSRRDRNCAAFV